MKAPNQIHSILLALLPLPLLAGCGGQSGTGARSGYPSSEPRTATFVMPGVVLPKTRPASASSLADDAEVVGVVVAGRARAYASG